MTARPAHCAAFLVFFACSSSNAPPSSGADAGTNGVPSDHVAGAGAKTYAENSESSNDCAVNPEDTAYTLDDVGLVISGKFEAASPTSDCYHFKSGTATYALVRIFEGGTPKLADAQLQCAGFSNSVIAPDTGRGPVESNLTCTVGVRPSPSAAGLAYTIEIRASK